MALLWDYRPICLPEIAVAISTFVAFGNPLPQPPTSSLAAVSGGVVERPSEPLEEEFCSPLDGNFSPQRGHLDSRCTKILILVLFSPASEGRRLLVHLYPVPLHAVLGLIARMRPTVILRFGCPSVYSRS